MMIILHVIARMDPKMGGVCRAVRTIISGLKKMNIQNEVVCLDNPNAKFLEEEGDEELKIHALGTSDNSWSYTPKMSTWLKNNFSKFDIIIVHGLWQFHSYAIRNIISRVRKKNDSKIFVMPHGMLDPYFQKARSRKLKAIRNWIYWKLIENKLINQSDGLLFTCETEKVLARQTFLPYRPKKEMVVGLGVTSPPPYSAKMSETFLHALPGLQSKKFLLFLSRLDEKKGIDILLKAYSEYQQHQSLKNGQLPELVIAGPGLKTVYGKKINAQVANDPFLSNHVHFPGMLSGDLKWSAFYNCEAFILPSHQENFGIAVIEAMSCGKAVLISNQVNIWSDISDANCSIVGDDTAEGVTDMLTRWQNLSPVQKKELGESALAAYNERFTVSTTTKALYISLNG